MEDAQIVELYWQREEQAIRETDAKYGSFCLKIALNLLSVREDAEETVNDTWQEAWNSMPTQRPTLLRPWLGRVVRNLSIDRWRRDHARKRFDGLTVLLEELEECVPAPRTVEQEIETAELGRIIDRWLGTLGKEDRTLFVRRYWNGETLKDLASGFGIPAKRLAGKMFRLRQSLRTVLEQEGITL